MKKILGSLTIVILIALSAYLGINASSLWISDTQDVNQKVVRTSNEIKSPLPSPTVKPTATPISYPDTYLLQGGAHTFQTFNNCGPASLSMALSYYDIFVSQAVLGQQLRPWQNPQGDNDDKSVTLEELGNEAEDRGFVAYHRPLGDPETIKRFVSNGMPVIARTWLYPNEDIGHYRVIKGYDDDRLIQDDSLQGKDIWYTFDEFNTIWKKFNYEYLVIVPEDKEDLARSILGDNVDKKVAWQKAVEFSQEQLADDPSDIYARFNLSVAYYNVGEYDAAIREYEKVENELPFRTLWYQIEPIFAYYEVGDYERVFEITNRVLNNANRAFSELYIIRGNIYEEQEKLSDARQEYQLAVKYNENLDEAQEALERVSR